MAKSSVSDILAAQRAVQALDRKGRLAILNDLLKQDLAPKANTAAKREIDTGMFANAPVTYTEGEEK